MTGEDCLEICWCDQSIGELQQRADDDAETVQESYSSTLCTRHLGPLSNVVESNAAPSQDTSSTGT